MMSMTSGSDWGEDMASGYEGVHCDTPGALRRKVLAWKPDVVLIYGYSWPGSLVLILSQPASWNSPGSSGPHDLPEGPAFSTRDPSETTAPPLDVEDVSITPLLRWA